MDTTSANQTGLVHMVMAVRTDQMLHHFLYGTEHSTISISLLNGKQIGYTCYSPTKIGFQWPIIVLETATLPTELPLTSACVAVKFVPPPSEEAIGVTDHFLPITDVRPLSVPTDYAGMRGPPDPLPFSFAGGCNSRTSSLKCLPLSWFASVILFLCIFCARTSLSSFALMTRECTSQDRFLGRLVALRSITTMVRIHSTSSA